MNSENTNNNLSLFHPNQVGVIVTDFEKENKDTTNLDELMDYIINSSDDENDDYPVNKIAKRK
jgi:hypothetical protein